MSCSFYSHRIFFNHRDYFTIFVYTGRGCAVRGGGVGAVVDPHNPGGGLPAPQTSQGFPPPLSELHFKLSPDLSVRYLSRFPGNL